MGERVPQYLEIYGFREEGIRNREMLRAKVVVVKNLIRKEQRKTIN